MDEAEGRPDTRSDRVMEDDAPSDTALACPAGNPPIGDFADRFDPFSGWTTDSTAGTCSVRSGGVGVESSVELSATFRMDGTLGACALKSQESYNFRDERAYIHLEPSALQIPDGVELFLSISDGEQTAEVTFRDGHFAFDASVSGAGALTPEPSEWSYIRIHQEASGYLSADVGRSEVEWDPFLGRYPLDSLELDLCDVRVSFGLRSVGPSPGPATVVVLGFNTVE